MKNELIKAIGAALYWRKQCEKVCSEPVRFVSSEENMLDEILNKIGYTNLTASERARVKRLAR